MTGDLPAQAQERYLAIKVLMMPRDTNPHGTIFGGVLLSYLDQAGATGARRAIRAAGWADRTVVTVALDRVEFKEPVYVGDVVSFWTRPLRLGRTSIAVHVSVEAERQGRMVQLTQAEVTYVAVALEGQQRRPVPIRGQ
jgi:acyl-CoA thioesterase YciA